MFNTKQVCANTRQGQPYKLPWNEQLYGTGSITKNE